MDFRSAFPTAALLGAAVGAVGVSMTPPDVKIPTTLVGDAIATPLLATTWDIPVVRNEPVERFVTLFSERQTDRMALYLKRSGRYEGMIREKLRERNMPEDLLYLSMIESGFNPTARSKAKAVGLWQFISDTGRRYGLRIDSYVDERRDPERSTDAALSYLEDLYGQFGSWYLAAAAYNTGEGRVGRIMREETGSERGVESDFWRIRRRLPSETREYVPLMVAAALVGKEPHKYGLGDVERYTPLATEEVAVVGGTDLGVVAEAVGISRGDIVELNPHLLREMTPPGKPYPVRVPAGRSATFAANFATARSRAAAKAPTRLAANAIERSSGSASERTHRVRSGESLWTIARRNNTSVDALRRANGIRRTSILRPGQQLAIPG